ncbi:hypothetical protein GALL_386050 [mine drainage metagenome]|uniref:Uncharacterized protein n=1 Tax=mine drainage metagenome TaxID=410659 RepID=A0A1J5Q8G6_9ZZZZ
MSCGQFGNVGLVGIHDRLIGNNCGIGCPGSSSSIACSLGGARHQRVGLYIGRISRVGSSHRSVVGRSEIAYGNLIGGDLGCIICNGSIRQHGSIDRIVCNLDGIDHLAIGDGMGSVSSSNSGLCNDCSLCCSLDCRDIRRNHHGISRCSGLGGGLSSRIGSSLGGGLGSRIGSSLGSGLGSRIGCGLGCGSLSSSCLRCSISRCMSRGLGCGSLSSSCLRCSISRCMSRSLGCGSLSSSCLRCSISRCMSRSSLLSSSLLSSSKLGCSLLCCLDCSRRTGGFRALGGNYGRIAARLGIECLVDWSDRLGVATHRHCSVGAFAWHRRRQITVVGDTRGSFLNDRVQTAAVFNRPQNGVDVPVVGRQRSVVMARRRGAGDLVVEGDFLIFAKGDLVAVVEDDIHLGAVGRPDGIALVNGIACLEHVLLARGAGDGQFTLDVCYSTDCISHDIPVTPVETGSC